MNDLVDATMVRRATLADAPALTRYFTDLMREGLATISRRPPPTLADEQRWLRDRVDREDLLVVLAVRGDDVVGILDTRRGAAQRAHSAEVGVSVAAGFRCCGLGSRLVAVLLDWAERQPWLERLGLDVLANNPRAIALYERHGFLQEGIRRRAWLVDGVAIDVVQMGLLRRDGRFTGAR